MSTLVSNHPAPQTRTGHPATQVRDASGYRIFSHGEMGEAHAFAHRMFDSGHIRAGRHGLETRLAGKRGQGSEWLHLQFHLALFELESGDWQRAHARFEAEILPAASSGAEALTDAPGLLWRLAIAAPGPVVLPWRPLWRTALANLHRVDKPFVQLHNLLAIAGAGDVSAIERWLESASATAMSPGEQRLQQFAPALKALATRSWRQAGILLQELAREVPGIGGSRAQNGLFEQLAAWCARQDFATSAHREHLDAA
ncbi:MAG: hypothetical protein PVI70_09810 [Gammaproteobacteria bacterium]|jgi:hypothetical protein